MLFLIFKCFSFCYSLSEMASIPFSTPESPPFRYVFSLQSFAIALCIIIVVCVYFYNNNCFINITDSCVCLLQHKVIFFFGEQSFVFISIFHAFLHKGKNSELMNANKKLTNYYVNESAKG